MENKNQKVKFPAEEYIRSGDWDAEMVATTARQGVASEDMHRIAKYLGDSPGGAATQDAAQQLHEWCKAKSKEENQ